LVLHRKEPVDRKNVLQVELRGMRGGGCEEHEGVWWLTDMYPCDEQSTKAIDGMADIMDSVADF
jgi:hypothetical protein